MTFGYDAADRVTTQTLPDLRAIQFGYDPNSNVTALTLPGRPAHTFTYTPVDLTASYTPPPVMGTGPTSYSFNADRDPTAIGRPDGQTTGFGYAPNGQLGAVTFSRGLLGYGYDSAGRVSTLSDPGGVDLSFTYDGALPLSETWSGPVAGVVTRAFTTTFGVATEEVNGTSGVAFGYDADRRLTSAGALTIARHPSHGLVTGTTLGTTTEAFEHNTFGEPSRQTAQVGSTDVFDVQTTRDALGRITQRIETVDGITRVFEYSYDLAGRLWQVGRNGTLVVRYIYDANGNRVSAEGEAGFVQGTYDDQDRLLTYGPASYTYTANGELASKTVAGQTTSYVYDTLGNLIQVTTPGGMVITYTVDGRGRRVGKSVDGVLVQGWLYADQLRPIAELDGAGTVVSRFVYGTRFNVPEYVIKNGITYRMFSDHLGSPRVVVNTATGAIVQRMDFQAFGEIIENTSPVWQPFGFAGGLYDPDTGLVRFGARDYDAETGRWTAKDPIGFQGGDSNLFGYVDNDSINWIDPSGRGKVGLFCKTVKGLLKRVSREGAQNALSKHKDVTVRGPGSSKKALRVGREQWGNKTVRYDPHQAGQKPHYQHKSGQRGHVKYSLPGATVGIDIFGDNIFGKAVDFFNPLSDLQDVLDLFVSEDESDDTGNGMGDIELQPDGPACGGCQP